MVQRTPLKRAGRSLSLDGTELLGFVGLEPLGAQRRHALGAGAYASAAPTLILAFAQIGRAHV